MNKIIKFLIHPFHKQHEIYRESHFKGLEENYKKKLLKKMKLDKNIFTKD